MIFDGKAFAKEIEEQVRNKVANLVKKPKVVSILVGDDPASGLYTRLKSESAKRCGVEFEVAKFEAGISSWELGNTITEIGDKQDVTGVMIQMPIPGMSRKEMHEIVKKIPLAKDVDGLRWGESRIMPATVKAIIAILTKINHWQGQFVVVGGTGTVGEPLVAWLKRDHQVSAIVANTKTADVGACTREAKVVISCVGKAGLVTGDMVRDGLIAIDVGMSSVEGKVVGDMTADVYQKASVAVPVPGGVGPVTVASLMANAAELAVSNRSF